MSTPSLPYGRRRARQFYCVDCQCGCRVYVGEKWWTGLRTGDFAIASEATFIESIKRLDNNEVRLVLRFVASAKTALAPSSAATRAQQPTRATTLAPLQRLQLTSSAAVRGGSVVVLSTRRVCGAVAFRRPWRARIFRTVCTVFPKPKPDKTTCLAFTSVQKSTSGSSVDCIVTLA